MGSDLLTSILPYLLTSFPLWFIVLNFAAKNMGRLILHFFCWERKKLPVAPPPLNTPLITVSRQRILANLEPEQILHGSATAVFYCTMTIASPRLIVLAPTCVASFSMFLAAKCSSLNHSVREINKSDFFECVSGRFEPTTPVQPCKS